MFNLLEPSWLLGKYRKFDLKLILYIIAGWTKLDETWHTDREQCDKSFGTRQFFLSKSKIIVDRASLGIVFDAKYLSKKKNT